MIETSEHTDAKGFSSLLPLLATQLPAGFEREVQHVFERLLDASTSTSPSTVWRPPASPLDVADARVHILSRLASGPCARGRDVVDVDDVPSARSETTVCMLPTRSSSLDALPLLPSWFWEPVSHACADISAALSSTAAPMTGRPSDELLLARLCRALNSVAIVETMYPTLMAGMPLDARVGCLLEVRASVVAAS